MAEKSLVNALLRRAGADRPAAEAAAPTKGFSVAQLQWAGRRVTLWDVGGERDYRGIWESYIPRANALLLVVDGADASEETLRDLGDVCARLRSAGRPFALLLSKRDKQGFAMLPFTDLLKREGVFAAARAVLEVSVEDADLLPKVLAALEACL